jgi:ATP-dependent helicase/DNAse subunit B
VRQLINIETTNFLRTTVIDLVKSPYFKMALAGDQGRPYAFANNWDLVTRRLGIFEGWQQWESQLKHRAKTDFVLVDEEDDLQNKGVVIPKQQIKSLFDTVSSLHDDFSAMPAQAEYSEYADMTIKIIDKYISLPADCTGREQTMFDEIYTAIESIKSFDHIKQKVGLDRFMEIVLEKIDNLSTELGDGNVPGVKVYDAMACRGIPCKVLFIMGMNEKLFPRLIREDPFLRDDSRSKIFSVLGNKIDRKLAGYDEERLLFYLLINSASDAVYCSHQRADEDGRPLVTSLFLRELPRPRHASPDEAGVSVSRRLSEKLGSVDIKYLTPKEVSIKGSLQNDTAGDAYLAQLGWDVDMLGRSRSAAKQQSSWTKLLPYDGITGPLPEFIEILEKKGISPTSLEKFATCPFQYYIAKVLDLRPFEDPVREETISSMELGSMYHKILENVYKELKIDTVTVAKLREVVTKEIESVIAGYEENPVGLYPIVWELTKESVRAGVLDFVVQDVQRIKETGFIPTYFEHDLAEKLEGVELGNIKKIKFHGMVDRVDVKKTNKELAFKIVDYKYKLKKRSLKMAGLIMKGQNLQLPIYQKLMKMFLGPKAVIDSASLYYLRRHEPTDKHDIDELPGTFWKDQGQEFVKMLDVLLSYIYAGGFFIYPTEAGMRGGDYCSWCDYSTVCRKNHQPVWYRLERDKLVDKYRDIKGK